jgi:hypothetical protein
VVRECCAIIRTFLKPWVFEKPTLAKIKINAMKFETLHGIIPYVLGAIHEGNT